MRAKKIILLISVLGTFSDYAQDLTFPIELQVDSSFMQINFYDAKTGKDFAKKFENLDSKKLVLFHYGGSHIQGEYPSSWTREKLTTKYSNGGRGMIFSYSAAKTYSSFNYVSSHKGTWVYGKSFQAPAKIPLGVCGMAVETNELNAKLQFNFKVTLPDEKYRLWVLFENDSLVPSFSVDIDSTKSYLFDCKNLKNVNGKNYFEILHEGHISEIKIQVLDSSLKGFRFRFYGIDVELQKQTGVVYHSLGVGAAAFRSILNIEKLAEHTTLLKPDIVILDFGTNDILYENRIDDNLASEIEKAISIFRSVNPEISIILTSTQDLFNKKKRGVITAGIEFRNLMDSLARKNNCLFWNWYDLSGGIGQVKIWNSLGYAQPDFVHLTIKGYRVKGQLLFESIQRTLGAIKNNPGLANFQVTPKSYENVTFNASTQKVKKMGKINIVPKAGKIYKVRNGDSLEKIAKKNGISVSKLKKLNGLKSDKIKADQIFRIR